jgi:hypothetical protein
MYRTDRQNRDAATMLCCCSFTTRARALIRQHRPKIADLALAHAPRDHSLVQVRGKVTSCDVARSRRMRSANHATTKALERRRGSPPVSSRSQNELCGVRRREPAGEQYLSVPCAT